MSGENGMPAIMSVTINTLFRKGPSNFTRLITGIVFSIVLMTLDHRFDQLEKVRTTLSTALSPVQYIVHLPLAGVNWASDTLIAYSTLMEENRQLKEEWQELKVRLLKYSVLEKENMRLRELLEEVQKEREGSSLGQEIVDQTEIGKLFGAKKKVRRGRKSK